MNGSIAHIEVIDSHTAGEPTRVVLSGGPQLKPGPILQQLQEFQTHHDRFRSAIVNEPRGSDVTVGALLCEPNEGYDAGVIFFNNVGYLKMCGHGTMGVVATLAHLGRIGPGPLRLETVVGEVGAKLHGDGSISVSNVPSYRTAKDVVVEVAGVGRVRGDVAWGGNWFFLVEEHGETLALSRLETLTNLAWRIRQAVNEQGYPAVDHVELFGPATLPGAHSRNFVLCPGKAYDRSPCGTGTSAKLACLAADGKLSAGQTWVQESIIGSLFHGRYAWEGKHIRPTITGRAFVNGKATLILNEDDPYCWGIRS